MVEKRYKSQMAGHRTRSTPQPVPLSNTTTTRNRQFRCRHDYTNLAISAKFYGSYALASSECVLRLPAWARHVPLTNKDLESSITRKRNSKRAETRHVAAQSLEQTFCSATNAITLWTSPGCRRGEIHTATSGYLIASRRTRG